MFEFVFPDYPPQALDIARAEISMQLDAPSREGRVALWVDISAKAVDVDNLRDRSLRYSIAPTFHTEWLEIPLEALRGRGANLLDGYHLVYDESAAGDDDSEPRPGAIYQDSDGGFTQVDMTFQYLGGRDYLVQASGKTEFGWSFRIEAVVPLVVVSAVSVRENGRDAPSAEVEEWFGRVFDPSVFQHQWARKGSADHGWYVLEGRTQPD